MFHSVLRYTAHSARRFSTSAGVPAASNVIATDMTLRALLRNLKLLSGMRNKEKFNVIVTGIEADGIASSMSKLEPCINFEVRKDSKSADIGLIEMNAGKNLDSVIIVQPYHVLESSDIIRKVHNCLAADEGTVGFIWTRPVTENWVEKYQESLRSTASNKRLLPPLEKSEFVLNWLEKHLDLEAHNFAPLKHRKYINTLEGNPKELAALLPYISDSRIPIEGSQELVASGLNAVEKWVEAYKQELKTIRGENAEDTKRLMSHFSQKKDLHLDLHIFHTQVLPTTK